MLGMKEFLRLRDSSPVFDVCRENGSIGIPAIVRGDGSVFSLGFISTTGPVIALASSPDRRTVYGLAGAMQELGLVFSYSMDAGVAAHGCLMADEPPERGVGNCCEPTCIAFAPDGKSIAVGAKDRLTCVFQYIFCVNAQK